MHQYQHQERNLSNPADAQLRLKRNFKIPLAVKKEVMHSLPVPQFFANDPNTFIVRT